MNDFRNQLDALMGKERNVPLSLRKRTVNYADPNLCKFDLLDICPYGDFFVNTKSHLGACPHTHDAYTKLRFAEDPDHRRWELRFAPPVVSFLEDQIRQVDRRIQEATRRMDKDVTSVSLPPESYLPPAERAEFETVSARIAELLDKVEKLAEEGKVEESLELNTEIEKLRTRKDELIKSHDPRGAIAAQDKQMQICDICGSMLQNNEMEQRRLAHINGRQHAGFARIREWLAEFHKKADDERKAGITVVPMDMPSAFPNLSAAAAPSSYTPDFAPPSVYGGGRDRDFRTPHDKEREYKDRDSERYSYSGSSASKDRDHPYSRGGAGDDRRRESYPSRDGDDHRRSRDSYDGGRDRPRDDRRDYRRDERRDDRRDDRYSRY